MQLSLPLDTWRTLWLAGWCAAAVLLAAWIANLLRRMGVGRRSVARLFTPGADGSETADPDAALSEGLLSRNLALAGYRDPAAVARFLTLTAFLAGLGMLVVAAFWRAGLTNQLLRNLQAAPSAVGELLVPVICLGPWLLCLMLASLPWLAVRRSRRLRVQRVEQDLPLSLELLATLSESGLGFDAALARLLEATDPDRPLAREFVTYQSNVLAGRTRVEALRRFARRLEIPSVTVFVSALTQAEQMGSGIAGTICRQAEDLRNRRRERANAFAMTLPVKRMFPLVICFMPGIFIWTLGPFLSQLCQILDTFIRVRNF